jgi:dihydroorotate dehydrogenase electron transfer subunit
VEYLLMARRDITATVTAQTSPVTGIYLMGVSAPKIAAQARPGQFCMLQTVGNIHDPLLRRPLSIHRTEADGTVHFLYRKTGRGTELLSMLKAGDSVKILGPLGNGFNWNQDIRCILVGGGMGIAPLLFLADSMAQKDGDIIVILGAATAGELACLDSFRAVCRANRLRTATEDGSLGHRGLVTDLLNHALENQEQAETGAGTTVMACGPWPMMKAVANICASRNIRCQVSLEAHMACGTGLCLGCAVPTANSAGGYIHVCKEGPVTDAKNIKW